MMYEWPVIVWCFHDFKVKKNENIFNTNCLLRKLITLLFSIQVFTGVVKQATKKIIPQRWRTPEKCAVEKHLGEYIVNKKIPGMKDCMNCIQAEKDLQGREWRHVKYYVYNRIKAKKY